MALLNMDRRIPPEPVTPVVPIRRDALELKVKQGMHKDAFDAALQRADHRRTMDSRDRVVSAGIKQVQVVQGQAGQNAPLSESRAESGGSVKSKDLRKSEQAEVKHSEHGVDFSHTQLSLKDFAESAPRYQSASGSTRTLGDESMAMLFKKINSNQCVLGESIALELIDDPSGVVGIKLTKSMNNSWAINLSLAPEEQLCDNDESELSQNIISQLQQSGILVDSVSVDVYQRATAARD